MLDLRSQKALFLALSVLFFSACGAPLKEADKANAPFSRSSDLRLKMDDLCRTLLASETAPNSKNVPLFSETCASPGTNAIEYKRLSQGTELGFSNIYVKTPDFTDTGENRDVLNIQTRTELWLNRPILNLVEQALPMLTDKANEDESSAKEDSNFDIELPNKATFNKETFEFFLEAILTSTRQQNGSINIKNKFNIAAKLIDRKYLAASIDSDKAEPLETSLIKRIHVLIMIVPHAQDVYLDLVTNVEVHSYGEAIDKIIKDRILRIIAQGVQKIPEFLDEAEKKQAEAKP